MRSIALPLLLCFSATAYAAPDCWEVVGWSTTGAPTLPAVPFAERAVVGPVSCDITPEGTRWLQVTQIESPATSAPAELYVRVPSWVTGLSDGETLFGGLRYQGTYRGIPMLWRSVTGSGVDDPTDWRAPSPATPKVGAVVLLQNQVNEWCTGNDPWDSADEWPCPLADATPMLWDHSTHWLVDIGSGQVELVGGAGYCTEIRSVGGSWVVAPETCSYAGANVDFEIVPVGNGHQLYDADSGLCLGMALDTWYGTQLENQALPCTDPQTVYDVITVVAGTSGGDLPVYPPEADL